MELDGYTAESVAEFNGALQFAKSVDGDSEYLWQRAIDMLENAKSNLTAKSDSIISVTYVFGKNKRVTILVSDKAAFKYFTPDGRKVIGWDTDEKLTQKFDFDPPVKENVTLYAKCEKTQSDSNASWVLPTFLPIGAAVIIASVIAAVILVKRKKGSKTSDK